MSAIFISYRREDSEDSTRAIFESLRPEFGKERLFMDVEAIALGSDFREAVERSLSDCGVFLAVIGPNWLNVKSPNDPNGPRRLDNPNDYVRQEVASALKKGALLPVIPVLVRGASMPTADQLPDDLKDLAYRNALTLNNLDWDSSVAKLSNTIRPHVVPVSLGKAVRFNGSGQIVSSTGTTTGTGSGGSSKGMFAVIAVAVLVLLAVGAYFGLRPKPTPVPVPTPQQQTQPQPQTAAVPTAKTDATPTTASTPEKAAPTNQPPLNARLVRNPNLKGLPGPVDVFIDGHQIGQIQSNPEGSTPLDFQVAAGEHSFKIVDSQRHATCAGTFSVNASQTHFKPAITAGGTQCVFDPTLQD